ncbi:hypothetical protein MRB53_042138 [Persea americana]|nr:hypothetical protein MRB53_042138 [Persea americana]
MIGSASRAIDSNSTLWDIVPMRHSSKETACFVDGLAKAAEDYKLKLRISAFIVLSLRLRKTPVEIRRRRLRRYVIIVRLKDNTTAKAPETASAYYIPHRSIPIVIGVSSRSSRGAMYRRKRSTR